MNASLYSLIRAARGPIVLIVLGLLCWLAGVAGALRAWWRATPAARERAAAPTYALVAMLFPLNTHYAVYSTFWSQLLFAMLAIWIGALHARERAP